MNQMPLLSAQSRTLSPLVSRSALEVERESQRRRFVADYRTENVLRLS